MLLFGVLLTPIQLAQRFVEAVNQPIVEINIGVQITSLAMNIFKYAALLLLLSLSAVYSTAQSNSTDSQALLQLLSDPTCQRACFLGIEPGVTSKAEFLSILEANNFPYTLLIEGGGNSDYEFTVTTTLPFISQRSQVISVQLDSDGVRQISIPLEVPISVVIEAYGSPDAVGFDNLYRMEYAEEALSFVTYWEDSRVYGVTLSTTIAPLMPDGRRSAFYASTPIMQDCFIFGVAPCIAPTRNPINALSIFIADAGGDQTVLTQFSDGTATLATLDGSGSRPAAGRTIVRYEWVLDAQNGYVVAEGVSPTLDLDLGKYYFTLIVTDDLSNTARDYVVITIEQPPPPTLTPTLSDEQLATIFPLPMNPPEGTPQARLSGDLEWVERGSETSLVAVCSRDMNPINIAGGNHRLITSADAEVWLVDTEGDNGNLGDFTVIRIPLTALPTPVLERLISVAVNDSISNAMNDKVGWLYLGYAHQSSVSVPPPPRNTYSAIDAISTIGESGNSGVEDEVEHLDISVYYISGPLPDGSIVARQPDNGVLTFTPDHDVYFHIYQVDRAIQATPEPFNRYGYVQIIDPLTLWPLSKDGITGDIDLNCP